MGGRGPSGEKEVDVVDIASEAPLARNGAMTLEANSSGKPNSTRRGADDETSCDEPFSLFHSCPAVELDSL